jgi:hypothetical protein
MNGAEMNGIWTEMNGILKEMFGIGDGIDKKRLIIIP